MNQQYDYRGDVAAIRAARPLIHNITNFVVMNNTANALLALGASPVMAHAEQEVEQMAAIASALVINVGTLSEPWVRGMELAMASAAKHGVPIVYDPVGAGATDYRNSVNHRLLSAVSPTIIRGNATEIMALEAIFCTNAGSAAGVTKGVDATDEACAAIEAAKSLAIRHKAVVVISGPVDYITDGCVVLENGHGAAIMSRVTGMGCTATAVCGAFAAVNPSPLLAAYGAMQLMGVTGEAAAAISGGVGSFQVNFLDLLCDLSEI